MPVPPLKRRTIVSVAAGVLAVASLMLVVRGGADPVAPAAVPPVAPSTVAQAALQPADLAGVNPPPATSTPPPPSPSWSPSSPSPTALTSATPTAPPVSPAASGSASASTSPSPPAATPSQSSVATTPVPDVTAQAAPERARPVTPLGERLRADVLVTATRPLDAQTLGALTRLGGKDGAAVLRRGTVTVGDSTVTAVGVDPSTFRAFTPEGTAEANGVWEAVARGEAVFAHQAQGRLDLTLGGPAAVAPDAGGQAQDLRVGAVATTNLPGSDLVVDDAVADELGLPAATGVLITARDGDPADLAREAEAALDGAGAVDLLTPPSDNPVAFLSGGEAAKAFGAFSYRYFADGTIAPDAEWVRANIRTESVPILGSVTCHRLMLPQLRGALQEIVDRGMAGTINAGEFGGCYVPRFIESNPQGSVSLHTWGIAVDLNVPGNQRGVPGDFDRRSVAVFKKWGFRWGGDWNYTDPMHFELGALLQDPPRG